MFEKPADKKGTKGSLAHVSSILHDVRLLIAGNTPTSASVAPATPAPAAPAVVASSPAKNTPSKLHRFLRFAEEKLGVKDATSREFSLAAQGYGPDILALVDEKELISCGLTAGDAIRLKRGALDWWNGPDAKRQKIDFPGFTGEPANLSQEPEYNKEDYSIRFEKRFHNSGSSSFFSSGIIPGCNRKAHEFSWHYFNQVTPSS